MSERVEAKELARVSALPLKQGERRGDKSRGESDERAVILVQLASDDPSGMRYAVIVKHPEFVDHGAGAPKSTSRQDAEVDRFLDELDARKRFAALTLALGGTVPAGLLPSQLAATGAVATQKAVSAADVADALEKADPAVRRRIVDSLTKLG